MNRTFLLLLALGLAVAGCAGQAPSGQNASEQSQGPQPSADQPAAPGAQQDAEALGQGALDDLDIAQSRMDDARGAFDNEDYALAHAYLNESKSYTLSARAKFSEACGIKSSQGEDVNCTGTLDRIDNCLVPMLDLISGLYSLVEDIKGECSQAGCPPGLKTDCGGLHSDAISLDAACNSTTAESISELCGSMK